MLVAGAFGVTARVEQASEIFPFSQFPFLAFSRFRVPLGSWVPPTKQLQFASLQFSSWEAERGAFAVGSRREGIT